MRVIRALTNYEKRAHFLNELLMQMDVLYDDGVEYWQTGKRRLYFEYNLCAQQHYHYLTSFAHCVYRSAILIIEVLYRLDHFSILKIQGHKEQQVLH